MSGYEGTLVLKNVNQALPESLLTHILSKYKHAIGFSQLAAGAAGKMDIITTNDPEVISVEQFMEFQNDLPADKPALFFFSANPNGTEDSIQPFAIIVNEAGDPVVSAVVDGDFPSFAEKDSKHSPAFLYTQKYLVPKLQNTWNMLDKNIGRFMGHLQQNVARMDMEMSLGAKGFICLFANTGEHLIFAKEQAATKFDWGWVTDPVGYSEDTSEVMAEEPVKKSLSGLTKKVTSTVREAFTPSSDKKVDDKQAAVDAGAASPITSTADALEVANPEKLWKVRRRVVEKLPADIKEKNAVKRWYKQRIGMLPPDYFRKRPDVDTFKDFQLTWDQLSPEEKQELASDKNNAPAIKSFQELPKDKIKTVEQKVQQPVEQTVADKPEENVQEHTPPSDVDVSRSIVLTQNEIAAIKKDFIDSSSVHKSYDRQSNLIADPAKWQAQENAKPTFAQVHSIKKSDTFFWDEEALLELGKVNLRALVLLACDYRRSDSEYKSFVGAVPSSTKENTQNMKDAAAASSTPVGGNQKRRRLGA